MWKAIADDHNKRYLIRPQSLFATETYSMLLILLFRLNCVCVAEMKREKEENKERREKMAEKLIYLLIKNAKGIFIVFHLIFEMRLLRHDEGFVRSVFPIRFPVWRFQAETTAFNLGIVL